MNNENKGLNPNTSDNDISNILVEDYKFTKIIYKAYKANNMYEIISAFLAVIGMVSLYNQDTTYGIIFISLSLYMFLISIPSNNDLELTGFNNFFIQLKNGAEALVSFFKFKTFYFLVEKDEECFIIKTNSFPSEEELGMKILLKSSKLSIIESEIINKKLKFKVKDA